MTMKLRNSASEMQSEASRLRATYRSANVEFVLPDYFVTESDAVICDAKHRESVVRFTRNANLVFGMTLCVIYRRIEDAGDKLAIKITFHRSIDLNPKGRPARR
jgi:hypothetical protein